LECKSVPVQWTLGSHDERYLRDFKKVFCPAFKAGPDIYDLRGVDREQGALVIVRPDQYIAHVLPLNAHQQLTVFLTASCVSLPCLIRTPHSSHAKSHITAAI